MKKLMNMLLATSLLLVLSVSLSYAENPISISYRLLNTVSTETTDAFVIEIEVSNTGSVDLTGVVIAPVSFLAGGVQGKAEIASIRVGQTEKKTMTIAAPRGLLDTDQLLFEVVYSAGNVPAKTVLKGTRKQG